MVVYHDFGSTSKDNGRPNPPEWYIAHWAAMMNSEGDSDVICDEIGYNTMVFEDSGDDSVNTTCINITSCGCYIRQWCFKTCCIAAVSRSNGEVGSCNCSVVVG